jgi:hypothetical protein
MIVKRKMKQRRREEEKAHELPTCTGISTDATKK